MNQPRDRQDLYRFGPQRNITFPSCLEYREVHRALHETGQTPRPILGQWARQVTLRFESDFTSKQPNPEESSPDVPEDSPGSTTPNAKDLVTQSPGKGGNSLTL